MRYNQHMCHLGGLAFQKGDLALALHYFRPVHYGLSATRATTQVLQWTRSPFVNVKPLLRAKKAGMTLR